MTRFTVRIFSKKFGVWKSRPITFYLHPSYLGGIPEVSQYIYMHSLVRLQP